MGWKGFQEEVVFELSQYTMHGRPHTQLFQIKNNVGFKAYAPDFNQSPSLNACVVLDRLLSLSYSFLNCTKKKKIIT